MLIPSKLPLAASVLLWNALLAGAIGAQVGGGYDTLYTVQGFESTELLGQSVYAVGDLDLDGVDDFAATGRGTSSSSVSSWMLTSGASGSTIAYKRESSSSTERFAALGDVDFDGIPEFLKDGASTSEIDVVAAATLLPVMTIGANDRVTSMAGVGDVNGDGVPDIGIGTENESTGGFNSGAVRVYSGADGSVLWTALGAFQERFGTAIARIEDLDGDGVDDVVAAGKGVLTGATKSGFGRVLSGAPGFTIAEAGVPQSWTHGGSLGDSVAVCSDFTGDGMQDFVMGASSAPTATSGGAVVAYSSADGSEWLCVEGKQFGESLGVSVSGLGDFDGDGVGDFAAGATGYDSVLGSNAGRATVYSGSDGSKLAQWVGESPGDTLGSAMTESKAVGQAAATLIVSESGWDSPLKGDVGRIRAISYSPFLEASSSGISVAQGGVLGIQLDFPQDAAGDAFQLLMSSTGTGPSQIGWLEIPLSVDNLLIDTFWGRYPSQLGGATGTLDSEGRAVAFIATYPGELSAILVGGRFWMAAITRTGGTFWRYSSAAVEIQFEP